ERATALYGARLALDMRLDRSNPAWGARLLFFRCGDLIVELAHDLKAGVGAGSDRLWGLSWRVPDAEAPRVARPASARRPTRSTPPRGVARRTPAARTGGCGRIRAAARRRPGAPPP